MPYFYRLYDLTVASSIEFPELMETDKRTPDLVIQEGLISELSFEGEFEIEDNRIRLQFEGVRYEITNGSRISYQILSSPNWADIKGHILASCLGGILHQRGLPILHGSAINHEGEAVLFCGNSGNGKSNTAAMFLKGGHQLISDDICPIIFQDNRPHLVNSFMNLKLWEQDISDIGLTDHNVSEFQSARDKKKLITDYEFDMKAIPIKAIYMLELIDEGEVLLEDISGFERLTYLIKNTFRYPFVAGRKKAKQDMVDYQRLNTAVRMKCLRRPSTGDTRARVKALIERDLLI